MASYDAATHTAWLIGGGYGTSTVWRFNLTSLLYSREDFGARKTVSSFGPIGEAQWAYIPAGRSVATACSHFPTRRLFLFSGYDPERGGTSANRGDLWVFSTTHKVWALLSNRDFSPVFNTMGQESSATNPGYLRSASCMATSDAIFIFGGTREGSGLTETLWRFNLTTLRNLTVKDTLYSNIHPTCNLQTAQDFRSATSVEIQVSTANSTSQPNCIRISRYTSVSWKSVDPLNFPTAQISPAMSLGIEDIQWPSYSSVPGNSVMPSVSADFRFPGTYPFIIVSALPSRSTGVVFVDPIDNQSSS